MLVVQTLHVLGLLQCPLTRSTPPPPSAPNAAAPPAPTTPAAILSNLADIVDRTANSALSTKEPLAATTTKLAIESLAAALAQELGSLDVTLDLPSSYALVGRGELRSVRISATALSALGVRASALSLEADDVLFALPPALPNLRRATIARATLRLTQDDLSRSPVLFGALEALLRELLRSGVSAAIGQQLPAGSSDLSVRLTRVEALERGRITLVADGSVAQADGTRLELEGLRVRSRVRASVASRLLILDTPELLSTFEGFGAKLEVGLPFLRGAGVPLPEWLSLRSVEIEDGVLSTAADITLSPVDYAELQTLAETVRTTGSAAQTVTVDAAASRSEPSGGSPPPALAP